MSEHKGPGLLHLLEEFLGGKLVRTAAIIAFSDEGKAYVMRLTDRETSKDPEKWILDETLYFALSGACKGEGKDFLWCWGPPFALIHLLATIIVGLSGRQALSEGQISEEGKIAQA